MADQRDFSYEDLFWPLLIGFFYQFELSLLYCRQVLTADDFLWTCSTIVLLCIDGGSVLI